MPPFSYLSVVRLIGVILGAIYLAHTGPHPWWMFGAASLALLFLP